MSIRARVVIAITLQQVDDTPHAQASAQGDHEDLQGTDSRGKEFHNYSETGNHVDNGESCALLLPSQNQNKKAAGGCPAVPVSGSFSFHFNVNCYILVL